MAPNMPSPREIFHNCTIQGPGKPLMPVDKEMIQDYLITKKWIHKKNVNKSHVTHVPLDAGMLYWLRGSSPTQQSALTETLFCYQGKQNHRSREHIHLLQKDIFKITTTQLQGNPKPTCIPKPNPISKHRALLQPSKCSPLHSKSTKSHIPIHHIQWPSKPNHHTIAQHPYSYGQHPPRSPCFLNDWSMNNPSQCVSPTSMTLTLVSKLETPAKLVYIAPSSSSSSLSPSGSTTSSLSTLSNLTNGKYSNSDPNSEPLASKAAIRSDWQLWPRWPITYNETTLRCFNSRPQAWTLNSLSLPLPNDPDNNSN